MTYEIDSWESEGGALAPERVTEPADKPHNATRNILEQVQDIYGQFVAFPSDEARDAVTLWTAHAHAFMAFESTPRLSISSTEPGSGKTRLLEVLEHLVPNPLNAVSLTPGVMWRSIENGHPTILIDEADTIFGKAGSGSAHRNLRAIINAGHRAGATVPRCVGTEDVKAFHVYCPVVLAGLGSLPETIAVRSIPIVMKRRRKGGPDIRPFRMRFAESALHKCRESLEAWSLASEPALSMAFPDMPVQDRQADVWEPLIAIADLAGEGWPERARNACIALTQVQSKRAPSIGVQLLADLREIFADREQMFTADILDALYQIDDRGWEAETLTARVLGKILGEYGVSPRTIRHGADTAKGYKLSSLSDPFERYIPECDV